MSGRHFDRLLQQPRNSVSLFEKLGWLVHQDPRDKESSTSSVSVKGEIFELTENLLASSSILLDPR